MGPTIADERVLAGTAAVVGVQFLDQYGDPAVSVAMPVTVEVVHSDGSTVLPAATATTAGLLPGTFTADLSASHTASLDILTATWAAADGASATTCVEVVGGFYASVSAIRSATPFLADDDRYDAEAIRFAREVTEVEFERITGTAFVPRFARVRATVGASGVVFFPHGDVHSATVRAFTLDGVELPTDIVAAGLGVCVGRGRGDIAVTYTYGHSRPPADILGAFYTRVGDVVARPKRGIPERTQTWTPAEGGTYSLVVPGQRGAKTGIPDVDVVLADYTTTEPLVA